MSFRYTVKKNPNQIQSCAQSISMVFKTQIDFSRARHHRRTFRTLHGRRTFFITPPSRPNSDDHISSPAETAERKKQLVINVNNVRQISCPGRIPKCVRVYGVYNITHTNCTGTEKVAWNRRAGVENREKWILLLAAHKILFETRASVSKCVFMFLKIKFCNGLAEDLHPHC